MVRILLVVAVIGGLLTGVFGFLNNTKKKDAIAARQQAEANLNTATTKLKKASDDLQAAKSSLDETQGKLTDLTARNDAAQSALTAAQAKVSDLESKVTAAQEEATTATAKLQDVQTQLGTQSDAAKAAQAKADELDRGKRQLEDELSQANAEVARLKDLIERSKTGVMPAGINGKVVSVNSNWNFVVLNIGEKDGLVENGELTVARTVQGQKRVIGKVKVVSTEANTAVADMEVSTLQAQIQPGDDVLN